MSAHGASFGTLVLLIEYPTLRLIYLHKVLLAPLFYYIYHKIQLIFVPEYNRQVIRVHNHVLSSSKPDVLGDHLNKSKREVVTAILPTIHLFYLSQTPASYFM
jgi:hypothetical protein